MATTKKRAAGPKVQAKKTPPKTLPTALVENAEREAAAKKDRLATSAQADIALIRRRQAQIAESFYDIGEALVRLKRPGVAQAAGHKSFTELCKKELEISATTANRLIAIVTRVPREEALKMGQQRALAFAQLALATPEPDSVMQLEKATRKLPSGKRLNLAKATTREIQSAAAEIRRTTPGAKPLRGRTTTTQERARAAELQAGLRAAGLTRARVAAVATKPGQGADVRIDQVPLKEIAALKKALGK